MDLGFSQGCSNEIIGLAPVPLGDLILWVKRVKQGASPGSELTNRPNHAPPCARSSIHPLAVCLLRAVVVY